MAKNSLVKWLGRGVNGCLAEETTIFVISHQKSIVTISDRMYELKDGTVERIDPSSVSRTGVV